MLAFSPLTADPVAAAAAIAVISLEDEHTSSNGKATVTVDKLRIPPLPSPSSNAEFPVIFSAPKFHELPPPSPPGPFDRNISETDFRRVREGETKEEWLLTEETDRDNLYPIRYWDIWQMNKKQEACIWIFEEIKGWDQDMRDWVEKMRTDEHWYMKHTLGFFAGAEPIVIKNIIENFRKEIKIEEARFFYGAQLFIEQVHHQSYLGMIDKYIKDPKEKEDLFKAVKTMPCVARKAEYGNKWMDPKRPFAHRLFAYSAFEGIFFSGSFCSIFWLRKRGLMPACSHINQLVARDEGLHSDFGLLLHSKLENKCTQEVAHQIVGEAIDIESFFCTEALPVALIGMNAPEMLQYLKFVGNRHLKQAGYDHLYPNATNPFDWMEMIGMEGKGNFHEVGISEYQKGSATGAFTLEADF
jgi:ribonucleotide reductase beta subunit family protein with ferritin-like domain